MTAPLFLYYEMVKKRDIRRGGGWSKFRNSRYVTFVRPLNQNMSNRHYLSQLVGPGLCRFLLYSILF